MSWAMVGAAAIGAISSHQASQRAKSLGGGGSIQGVDAKQIKKAYDQTQMSIQQQQDFVKALQAQNGIANQSSVFQQQQGLAGQLQGVIDGTGPNPAQNMLNQATGQNVAQQAALMAGQRGASANTGLMARQAAMQGSAAQQTAAGQAASMQAQQSLAGMQALQAQQASMGSLAGNQVNQEQAANANLGAQTQGQQANLFGLQQNANTANNAANMQSSQQNANLMGNLMGAAGSAIGMLGSSGGGNSKPTSSTPSSNQWYNWATQKAEGGEIEAPVQTPVTSGPRSTLGRLMNGVAMAKGGQVPALVSPGEVRIPARDVKQVAEGSKSAMQGERIPGKPKVGGAKDDYANDTVKKTLTEGDIIIPRSITQGKNPEKNAAEFVRAILAKKALPKR